MNCPRCDVEMVIGIAIEPAFYGSMGCRAISIMPIKPIGYDQMKIVNVFKCPKCGHSDDGDGKLVQSL